MRNSEDIWRHVDAHQDDFIALSDRVWEIPELCYAEFRSCAEHTAMLEAKGFRITRDVAGIPTAVMGEAGEDGPVIAILGEYDALPGLSQAAGVAEQQPLPGAGFGHGCGHNMLGSASMLAATAVKDYLDANGIKGRVRYYGCPAEEGGAAKGFMARAGVFSDVDVAISWHPSSFSGVNPANSLANTRIDFSFHGRASHAAASPHLGRSALDAVELMSVGVNYMREHMPSDARIHYAYTDMGGVAPNVVQATSAVLYLIRARDLTTMNALFERVKKIAEGAALMTETTVEVEVDKACSNMLGNDPLERAMQANLDALGAPPFDAADHAAAARFHATVTNEEIESGAKRFGVPVEKGAVLHNGVVPMSEQRPFMSGSTDVSDVSWAVPTAQVWTACYTFGTPGHSWQLTGQGRLPAAHKGMTQAAKIMAATAVDALLDPALLAKAKADHAARTAATPYVCPIPEGVVPPCSR